MPAQSTTSNARLWIVALNDGESIEIRRILDAAGELYAVSNQRWGARWDRLEAPVVELLKRFQLDKPDAVVYGVELAGPNSFRAINIDHHRYAGDDRGHVMSSLEQVAALLSRPLTQWQKLVALNDRGYIPAMLAAGASCREVIAVRRQDRLAQGVTAENSRIAKRDIRTARWIGARVRVDCPDGFTSAHSDRLFDRAQEILLTSATSWSYSGPRHRQLATMDFAENHWSGGAEESGYFGIESPGAATKRQIIELLGMPE